MDYSHRLISLLPMQPNRSLVESNIRRIGLSFTTLLTTSNEQTRQNCRTKRKENRVNHWVALSVTVVRCATLNTSTLYSCWYWTLYGSGKKKAVSMMAVCLCACMRACVWMCVRACVWPSSTSSSTSRLLPQGSWGGAQLWGIAAADDVMLSRQQQWTLGYPICLISGHQHSVTWDRKAYLQPARTSLGLNFIGPI